MTHQAKHVIFPHTSLKAGEFLIFQIFFKFQLGGFSGVLIPNMNLKLNVGRVLSVKTKIISNRTSKTPQP